MQNKKAFSILEKAFLLKNIVSFLFFGSSRAPTPTEIVGT